MFSQIDWRKEKTHHKGKYQKPNFPRVIQASKSNESSATKLPWGNLVWQSGLGEHSPESNLTEVTKVKLPKT